MCLGVFFDVVFSRLSLGKHLCSSLAMAMFKQAWHCSIGLNENVCLKGQSVVCGKCTSFFLGRLQTSVSVPHCLCVVVATPTHILRGVLQALFYLNSFTDSFSNMSLVIESRSYCGIHPHSFLAAESSIWLGQLSAMLCFKGSIS